MPSAPATTTSRAISRNRPCSAIPGRSARLRAVAYGIGQALWKPAIHEVVAIVGQHKRAIGFVAELRTTTQRVQPAHVGLGAKRENLYR